MAGKINRQSESVVIRSLRRLKEIYWPSGVRDVVLDHEEEEPGFLDCLPVSFDLHETFLVCDKFLNHM